MMQQHHQVKHKITKRCGFNNIISTNQFINFKLQMVLISNSSKLLFCLTAILVVFYSGVRAQEDSNQWNDLIAQIRTTLNLAKKNIWNQIEPDQPVWNMPPWLGTFFLSEYYFELKALNITGDFALKTQFNETFFTQKLISEQSPDGSWHQLVDLNKKEGSLDATIFNYWYLKDVGVDENSQTMKKAKKFILDHGGIEQAQMMTKYKLAAFGQYEWHLVHYVPLFIFKNWFPYSLMYIKDYVAQWVYPHLIGLAYLRYHKTIFPVSKVCLSELRTSRSTVCEEELAKHPGTLGFKKLERDADVENLLQEGIKLTGRRGAVGAYTISTLLYLMSFKDFTLRYSNQEMLQYYQTNVMKSMQFVQDMYFNRRVPYEGSLDDGRYWDTLLASFALLEAGEPIAKLHPTVQFMINTAVQPNGGIPYGQQFQYAPDIDDTAMLLFLYGVMNKNMTGNYSFGTYQQQINKTYTWLKSTQNSDGGFPAFDKDKNDDQYKLIKYIFKITRIDKSAEIFDPSCADIVGHLLEGMGENGIYDTEVINKAVQFLYETRKDGMWSARWGINYIYAVGAVFPGLARVGYNLNQTWLLNIIKRIQALQQPDGGFGEDSDSYNVDHYVEGKTTVSMTAWGLLAYLEVAEYMDVDDNILGAVQYILNNFKENKNKFYDRSVVGTGHRGLLNLQYPVYAYSFPVIALSRAKAYFEGTRKPLINEEVNAKVVQYESIQNVQHAGL